MNEAPIDQSIVLLTALLVALAGLLKAMRGFIAILTQASTVSRNEKLCKGKCPQCVERVRRIRHRQRVKHQVQHTLIPNPRKIPRKSNRLKRAKTRLSK